MTQLDKLEEEGTEQKPEEVGGGAVIDEQVDSDLSLKKGHTHKLHNKHTRAVNDTHTCANMIHMHANVQIFSTRY